jgi:hypothetical protein
MFRLIFRLIGFLAAAAAFASLVVDGTQSIAEGAITLTMLSQTLTEFFPRQFPLLQGGVEHTIHPFLWDPVLVHVLALPTWLVVGVCGLLLLAMTRKPAEKIGQLNR